MYLDTIYVYIFHKFSATLNFGALNYATCTSDLWPFFSFMVATRCAQTSSGLFFFFFTGQLHLLKLLSCCFAAFVLLGSRAGW